MRIVVDGKPYDVQSSPIRATVIHGLAGKDLHYAMIRSNEPDRMIGPSEIIPVKEGDSFDVFPKTNLGEVWGIYP